MELREADAGQVDDKEAHLVFTDSLFFSADLLKDFIDKSRQLKTRTVCALKPGLTTLRTVVATQNVAAYSDRIEYNPRYVPAEGQGNPAPVIIDADQASEGLELRTSATNNYIVVRNARRQEKYFNS